MSNTNKIAIKKANGSNAAVMIGVWMIPWTAITLTMLYGILFDNGGKTGSYLSILIPLLIIGLVVIRQFLWNLRGRDEIEFLEHTVKLSKKGSFLLRPGTEVTYESFQEFSLSDSAGAPSWVVLWGFGGNKIIAGCGTFNRSLGQGLSESEAEKFVKLLNKKVEDRKLN